MYPLAILHKTHELLLIIKNVYVRVCIYREAKSLIHLVSMSHLENGNSKIFS